MAAIPAQPRKIQLIPVADIEIGSNRLRGLSRARVEGLKVAIADPDSPPLLPIEVCRLPGKSTWMLLDGLHRLTAAHESGVEAIEALAHDNSTITARMVELQRNLFTAELAPLEKAKHIAELYYLERAKRGLAPGDDPRKLGGRPRKSFAEAEKETSALSAEVSLSGAVGRSIGLQERQIRKYLSLYRALSPAAAEKLERFRVDLPAAQMMLLAKQAEDVQLEIVNRLIVPADHPDKAEQAKRAKTVSAALAAIQKRPVKADDDSKRLSAFIGAFSRMGVAEKKGALHQLASHLPAKYRIHGPDDHEDMADITSALLAAHGLLVKLIHGDEPVDDDDLKDVAVQIEGVLPVVAAFRREEA